MRMRKRKGWVLLLAAALLIGMLPVGNTPVSKAEATSAPEGKYGLSNPRNVNGTVTWDCVYFGNYWQNDTNDDGVADKEDEKEPIKWRVLFVDGDDAFLLANTNLDVQTYNDTFEEVTWETCTMRSWLNGYGADENVCGKDYSDNNFLDNAFTESEQAAIKDTVVENEDNPYYGTEGGNNTIDKVYLLSGSEAMTPSYGFALTDDSATREAVNTAYVAAGGEINSGGMFGAGSRAYWWLRSPGAGSRVASNVDINGGVSQDADGVVTDYYRAARPALHLNLSSTSSWLPAGTVNSDGVEIGIATPTPKPTVTPPATQSSSPSAEPTQAPGTSGTEGISPSPAPASPQTTQNVQPQTTVTPGKVTALKLTAKKKAIQASWKKAADAAGYEVQVSTSKKFAKKSVKTTKKTKLTISKLKPKKKYFVRVRAYSVTNGKKTYGKWSKVTNIKTKK